MTASIFERAEQNPLDFPVKKGLMRPDENAITQAPPKPELSFGQKLVGLNFNPSNDDAVGTVKQLFADAADIVNNIYQQSEASPLSSQLYHHTIGEILNAQMNCVKLLTLKY